MRMTMKTLSKSLALRICLAGTLTLAVGSSIVKMYEPKAHVHMHATAAGPHKKTPSVRPLRDFVGAPEHGPAVPLVRQVVETFIRVVSNA
jgi:hypothetical protein